MHKRILLVLALLALLSGVSAAAAQTATFTPTPEGQWCYHFDFTLDNQGFLTLGQGEYASGGFRTTPVNFGALQVGYTHNLTVVPSQVDFVLEKGPFTSGSVDLEVEGELFGLQQEYTQYVLSPDFNRVRLTVSPASASDFNNTLTLYVAASQEMFLTDIYVYGFGVAPFEDNCTTAAPAATATATAPVLTPNACLLPGQPTPTLEFTPTSTPSSCDTWTHIIDFRVSDGGFAPYGTCGKGVWVAGEGWQAQLDCDGTGRVVRIALDVPAYGYANRARFVSTFFSVTNGQTGVAWSDSATGSGVDLFVSSGMFNGTFDRTSSILSSPAYGNFLYVSGGNGTSSGAGNSFYIREVQIWGTGTNPFTGETSSCPIATAVPLCTLTPTFTRTPTRTPIPTYISPTAPPTRTPNPTIAPTLLTPSAATSTFAPTTTALPPPTFGAPLPGGNGGLPVAGGGLGGLSQIADSVTGAISAAWTRGTIYAGNIGTTASRVLNGWNNAVPTAPPLLPRCATEPLLSELCAFWYIMRHTVLSGAIGVLLVPMATIVIDLVAVFYFLRYARAIIARIGKLLESS